MFALDNGKKPGSRPRRGSFGQQAVDMRTKPRRHARRLRAASPTATVSTHAQHAPGLPALFPSRPSFVLPALHSVGFFVNDPSERIGDLRGGVTGQFSTLAQTFD
jgi:hypothetical protein